MVNVKGVLGGGACAGLVALLVIPAAPPLQPPEIRFRQTAERAGLNFIFMNDPTPQKYMIEGVPGGVAVFDYDGDGRPDIYFTNGASVPSLEKFDPKFLNRLYRNEGGMKFSDVTAAAGVGGAGYSMGAAAADYDNDGHVDLFVTGVNRNVLYRNLGNGKFEDVTAAAGIRSAVWSAAAGWFDYDRDGLPDLFVVNYLKWSQGLDRFCGKPEIGLRIYCSPSYFEGLPNTLYRNLGNGKFEDVSVKSGVASHPGKGMSVAFADYDSDGWPDAFVTNDTVANSLFRNKGDGTFEEVALNAGVAFDPAGKAISNMGTDFRDYDNDGRPDLIITALSKQTFPLFRNDGNGGFADAGYTSGLSRLSVDASGWCAGFVDLNNDGWKDIFTANSHVNDQVERLESTAYRQANSIFMNLGNGHFSDVSAAAGADFQARRAHRGCAFADFDGDGKLDVVVSALGEPAELWENVSPGREHWIDIQLVGRKSNRDGIGAKIHIGTQVNHMTTATGYASSSHTPVHFGLGTMQQIGTVEIDWPGGRKQVLHNIRADQTLKVVEEF
ncbi:MAG: enediyne biosynthesis protein [Bryobacterales bacterium]|nr:enediyne biosynthesis protein [Bryobacterales bacterium]